MGDNKYVYVKLLTVPSTSTEIHVTVFERLDEAMYGMTDEWEQDRSPPEKGNEPYSWRWRHKRPPADMTITISKEQVVR